MEMVLLTHHLHRLLHRSDPDHRRLVEAVAQASGLARHLDHHRRRHSSQDHQHRLRLDTANPHSRHRHRRRLQLGWDKAQSRRRRFHRHHHPVGTVVGLAGRLGRWVGEVVPGHLCQWGDLQRSRVLGLEPIVTLVKTQDLSRNIVLVLKCLCNLSRGRSERQGKMVAESIRCNECESIRAK